MSTYYGYAERDDESHIDWSVIGKDINKKLKAEVDRRDKLKADIEEKSREYQTTLDNVPIGADESATKNAIAYTTDAAEYKLGLTKALKFGDMNVKKYLQATNSLRIDTEGAFVMYKNYQKYNDQKIARMDSTDASKRGNVLESALYKHTGGYMNMKNSRPFIDPATGRVLYARMDKDGKRLIGEEGKYPPISIPMMNNYITSEIASFDVDKAVDDTTKSIGASSVEVQFYGADGKAKFTHSVLINDKTQTMFKELKELEENAGLRSNIPDLQTYIDKYEDAKNAKVDFYMGNDNNVVDYLVRMDKGYETTFDEDEFKEDGKMILIKQDPEIDGYELVFPTDAKEDAKEALSAAIDAKQESLVKVTSDEHYRLPDTSTEKADSAAEVQEKKNQEKAYTDIKPWSIDFKEFVESKGKGKNNFLNILAKRNLQKNAKASGMMVDLNIVEDGGRANIVAKIKDGKGGYYNHVVSTDIQNKSMKNLAMDLLKDAHMPTIDQSSEKYLNEFLKAAGIYDNIKRQHAFEIDTGGTGLYKPTDKADYPGSVARLEETISWGDVSLWEIQGGVYGPMGAWGPDLATKNAGELEQNFTDVFKSNFSDATISHDRNTFKRIGLEVIARDAAATEEKVGNVYITEFESHVHTIDPEWGTSIAFPVTKITSLNIPGYAKEMQRREKAGEEIKMDRAMAKILDPDNDHKTAEYMAAYKQKDEYKNRASTWKAKEGQKPLEYDEWKLTLLIDAAGNIIEDQSMDAFGDYLDKFE